jgi:hypothetical protein
MNVYSDFIIQDFRRHVTIFSLHIIYPTHLILLDLFTLIKLGNG